MPSDTDVLAELDLGEPPQELLAWAKKEFGEDPDTRCQVLEDFRNMIFDRGECTPHRTDDAFLLRFLRGRYFQLQRAHRLLVNYYDFKENNPEMYEDVNLKQLALMGEDDIITVPPYREQSGRRILLYRLGNWDTKKYSINTLFQATMVILELAILEQRAQILGGICIFDLGGLSMAQAWQLTPRIASKVIQVMVTCYPMRLEALHVINQPWIFDMVFKVFKPMLTDIMKERLFLHQDLDSLHEHINPKYLPERYGGVHPDYNFNEWMYFLYGSEKVREEISSLGYDVVDYLEPPEVGLTPLTLTAKQNID